MFSNSIDDDGIIINSCSEMHVQRNSDQSPPFSLHNGVEQGGDVSPILFFIYIVILLQKLTDSCLGCHVDCTFAGAFGYADDLALVSQSLSWLRQLIQIYKFWNLSIVHVLNKIEVPLLSVYESSVCKNVRILC